MGEQDMFGTGGPPGGGDAPPRGGPSEPLAERMRPRTLQELVGQREVLGPGTFLRTAIENDRIPSLILWGPPGSGKTSIARVIASVTKADFVPFSAVLSGVKDVRRVVQEARAARRARGTRTILFVDEIHRFNKAQQDAFLPHVEAGTIVLVGATTENPFFEVTSPLLSRCRVVKLRPLEAGDLAAICRKALADPDRGLGRSGVRVPDEVLAVLARHADGDARRALNTLEAAVEHAARMDREEVDGEVLRKALEVPVLRYDRSYEEHYNVVSAFIKSMRGSDPDAAVYYMVRMLEGGEDPSFVCRRMIIFAAEDVGNADPQALQVAVAAKDAWEYLGMPEAAIPMAQAATYLACAQKSNASYKALRAAQEAVRRTGSLEVPMHLRNAPVKGMKDLGYSRGYEYPHDHEGAFVPRHYLPDGLRGSVFYRPTDRGAERGIRERLERWRALRDGEKDA